MKYFVLISCLIAVSYADTTDLIDNLLNSFKIAGLTCKGEVGATDADTAAMRAHEIPTTPTGKCFLACIHKKLNLMTDDGKFNKDQAYKMIENVKEIDEGMYGKLMKAADTCYAEVKELPDECETATNMFICIKKEKDANGIPDFDI